MLSFRKGEDMNIVFGTAIKVIAGFYLGCTGIVTGPSHPPINAYPVELTCLVYRGNVGSKEIVVTELTASEFMVTGTPSR